MVFCWLVCLPVASLWAGPQPEQSDRLKDDLTPVGALREGNTDGRIPEWTGGINQPPQGYQPGTVHIDPFDGESALLRINASNLDEYATHLSPGHIAMLRKYGESYFMDVYPTHRSAAFEQRIYDKTAANGITGHLSKHIMICNQGVLSPTGRTIVTARQVSTLILRPASSHHSPCVAEVDVNRPVNWVVL